MTKQFEKLTVCLDMKGCPNRCKHCWLGVIPNGNLNKNDLIYIANEFKKVTKKIQVYSWFREPDYFNNYQEIFELEKQLSDFHYNHFELASYFKIVRDNEYAKWLKSIGVNEVQLTFFGLEETTDYYIGRKGAFNELIASIDILLKAKITPRIQLFLFKDNLKEMEALINFFKDINLEEKCKEVNDHFSLFAHLSVCIGESMKLYESRLEESDIKDIPSYILTNSFSHFKTTSVKEIFGDKESKLYNYFLNNDYKIDLIDSHPVFYIDKDFNVYSNKGTISKVWSLGCLKELTIEQIIENYLNNRCIAFNAYNNIPFKEMVETVSNKNSNKLFTKDDYIIYILDKYLNK